MQTIKELQDEVIEEFDGLDDWMDKYQMLIDLGNDLEPLEERYKTPENIIEGCQSRVWVQSARPPLAHPLQRTAGNDKADKGLRRGVQQLNHAIMSEKRKLRTIEMHRLSIDEYRNSRKLPLVVVLDNVRSLYNVGSIFRTCDAFRLEAICLCGITATPPHNEIHKTALGAEDSVAWSYHASAIEAVEQLKSRGYTVVAVEQAEGSVKAPIELPDEDTGKYALVLGNEVKGVSQEVVDASDM